MGKEGNSKTDAMRAQREEAWKRRESKPSSQTQTPSAETDGSAPSSRSGTASSQTAGKKRASTAGSALGTVEEAKCLECGKTRAVRYGKITHHMKGFGKQCPGAGKVVGS